MPRFSDLSQDAKADLWAALAVRHAEGIGVRRAARLAEHYASLREAVEAALSRPKEWTELELVPARAAGLFAKQQWREKAKEEWTLLQKHPFRFLHYGSPAYPELLAQTAEPPLLLYYEGDQSLFYGPGIGVVGSRACTNEGIAVAAFFSGGLSRAGVSVVSGLAVGIDRAAHVAGLEGPGRSIGVLGTGIDVLYPPDNRDLAGRMRAQGLLVSEFSPGTPATPKNFPVRNRIISGLSQGVLVVEAAARSGSLITARLALEQGREVFAVPGHTVAAVSEGCRTLIRNGAKPVFTPDDVLLELAPQLAAEARLALEQRLRDAKNVEADRTSKGRSLLARTKTANPAPPGGELPWSAPPPPPKPARKKAEKTLDSAAPRNVAPRKAAGAAPPAGLPLDGDGRQALPVAQGPPPSPEEARLLAALADGPLHIDDLSRALEADVALVSRMLTLLEMRRLVARLPGMRYAGENA